MATELSGTAGRGGADVSTQGEILLQTSCIWATGGRRHNWRAGSNSKAATAI
jgi:hypothetical protein